MAATLYDAEMSGGTVRFAEFFTLNRARSSRSGCSTIRPSIGPGAAAEIGHLAGLAQIHRRPAGQPRGVLPDTQQAESCRSPRRPARLRHREATKPSRAGAGWQTP